MKRVFNKLPSLDILINGINITIDNAIDLQDTARSLFEVGKYNHSISLSLIAKQELGKVKVLGYLAAYTFDGLPEPKHLTDAFFSHKDKVTMSKVIDAISSPDTSLSEIIDISLNNTPKSTDDIDEEKLRQQSLYVDFVKGNNTWHNPQKIEKEIADKILSKTQKVLDRIMQEKDAGFYSQEYYEYYCPHQIRLRNKYKKELENMEMDVFAKMQEELKVVLEEALKKGILKGDIKFHRDII